MVVEHPPLQGAPDRDDILLGRDTWKTTSENHLRGITAGPGSDPEETDEVMLVRSRLSRIMFLRNFFDYPISLNRTTIANLGLRRMAAIGAGYLWAKCFPIRPACTLEDFFINQFGIELYKTFFRDYTEKVWGVPCRDISAHWGAQRIKGLSLSKALSHALRRIAARREATDRKTVETSLIESFLYPKYGPGQLWETVAARIRARGGRINVHRRVVGLRADGERIAELDVEDAATGERTAVTGDYVLSSMPVRELVAGLDTTVPDDVRAAAAGLQYRSFMTVGLLVRRLKLTNTTARKTVNNIIPDNWIYIQEPDVRVGRVQIYNNWSPYLVADPDTVWIGMEYFCNEGDAMWTTPDDAFARFAVSELEKIGMADTRDVLDTTVIREPKAYPAYFGTFRDFAVIRDYLDRFANLFLVGRNGMHRYNNMDHSMLSAMAAVENILRGTADKESIWSVNAETDYHEAKDDC